MSEETPGAAGTAETPPATPAAPPATPDLTALLKELIDERREARKDSKAIKEYFESEKARKEAKAAGKLPVPTQPATPDDALAKVTELEFKLAVKDAIQGAGISDPKFAALIEKAARADRPSDLSAFVAEYASISPKAQGAPAVPPVVASPTNTGPPAPPPIAPNLPANPAKWPEEVIRKMSPVEFMAALKAFQNGGQGRSWNPYQKGYIKLPHEK